MSNLYKTACQNIQKTCLTISAGSAIALGSLMMPQIASAATIESFSISGELRDNPINIPTFSGASLTGTFDLNAGTDDLTSWDIVLTANGGETFEFSQGELGDSANIYLQDLSSLGYGLSDQLTINFTEDNGSDADSILQLTFKTDYDIVSNTTLTELLNGDPEIGTVDTLLNGTMQFNQGSDLTRLKFASFTTANEETVSPVPEASTLAMLGLGSLMVFGLARRNRKSPSVQTA